MELCTSAAVISFVEKVEKQGAAFYQEAAAGELGDTFTAFAKENQRFINDVKRAYYSAVTDAFETGFCFQGLHGEVEIPAAPASSQEAVAAALELERALRDFYQEASRQSKSLLGDLSRAMARVAKARDKRIAQLEQLQAES